MKREGEQNWEREREGERGEGEGGRWGKGSDKYCSSCTQL